MPNYSKWFVVPSGLNAQQYVVKNRMDEILYRGTLKQCQDFMVILKEYKYQ